MELIFVIGVISKNAPDWSFITKGKINICVGKLISIMADITTTLSVSKKFHDWLKSKGSKGENYEDIIKKLLKPEFVKEFESFKSSSK